MPLLARFVPPALARLANQPIEPAMLTRLLPLVLALADIAASTAAAQPRQPNIIVLLADDLGFADLSLHGNKEIQTPNIDALARRGVRCTQGYTSGAYCSPTRAGLLTGRYQNRFGHEFNPVRAIYGGVDQGLPIDQSTIAQRLKSAGYATGLIGKWHLGEVGKFHPLQRGFDEFFGHLSGAHSYLQSQDEQYGPIYRGRTPIEFKGYLTDVLAEEAGAFIDRHRAKPFFLYLAFNAVHTPMQAKPDFLKKFEHVHDPNRRTYLAMLASLDAAVGSVFAKLAATGLENDTLVFFFSDNGGPVGKFASNGSSNLPHRGSKGDLWEGGIHVPFLVVWKSKLPAGREFTHPVIQLDILPTALAAAGIAQSGSQNIDGVNLLPHLRGEKKSAPHDRLFWRFGSQMAVRQGSWKLVRASQGKTEYSDVAVRPMLFNLEEDVGEKNDLAAKNPALVRQLQAAWDGWNVGNEAPRWPATVRGKPFLNP